MTALSFVVAFVAAFVFGSLLEYWVHRLMHRGVLLAARHVAHHQANEAKGVVPEFLDYILGASIFLPWLYLVSVPAGTGWLLGGVVYGLFSAFGHQLQHDNPAACFWMRRMPVHWVHHRYDMSRFNFGLALDVWDRVFGTYRLVEWKPHELEARYGPGLLDVRWW